MKLVKWSLLTVTVVLCIWPNIQYTVASNCNVLSNSGKEFYLGVPILNNTDEEYNFYIYVTSMQTGHVDVEFKKLNQTTRATLNHGAAAIKVPKEYAIQSAHNGILLTSDVDVSVTVVSQPHIDQNGCYRCGEAMDGYLALPKQVLSRKYLIASSETSKSPEKNKETELLIIAVSDNTTISITPDGASYSLPKVTLNRLDSYNFKAMHDISGAQVSSNKPVAVISAIGMSRVPGVPTINLYAESIFEWMYPLEFAALDYIVPSLQNRNDFVIRVLATENNTTVTFDNHTLTTQSVVVNTAQTRPYAFKNSPVYIHADKPIFVYQYGTSTDDVTSGGAFVRNIPALTHYVNNATFSINTDVQIDNYIQVMVPHGASVTLDGTNISQPTTNISTVHVNGSLYHVYTVDIISPTNQQLKTQTLSSNGSVFGAVIAGYRYGPCTQCAYGYPLAMQRTECSAETLPTTTPMPPTTSMTSAAYSTVTSGTVTPGQGPLCLECSDLAELYLCQDYKRCSADQVCYVERYKNSASHIRYRSGCTDNTHCSPWKAQCRECCHGNFCNNRGCGGSNSLPQLGVVRGPLCLSCLHASSIDSCQTLSYCEKDEVCSIEVSRLFGTIKHYNMGCARADCFTLEHKRAEKPLCTQCCKEDFCNYQCNNSSSPGLPIIG